MSGSWRVHLLLLRLHDLLGTARRLVDRSLPIFRNGTAWRHVARALRCSTGARLRLCLLGLENVFLLSSRLSSSYSTLDAKSIRQNRPLYLSVFFELLNLPLSQLIHMCTHTSSILLLDQVHHSTDATLHGSLDPLLIIGSITISIID